MTTQEPQAQTPRIHPETEVGHLALTVADLDGSVDFYASEIGFEVLHRDVSSATLGIAGLPMLVLTEEKGANPAPSHATGLYHFAILLPTRADLGRWLRHWLDLGYPMVAQADHAVSEALYLADPDGNGIEIYADRPRETWRWIGDHVHMTTLPLDVEDLLAETERQNEPWTGLPVGTRIGHIHLQIADIRAAERFYRDLLGFDVVARMPGALFVSAGGYHHHIGLNNWQSQGGTAAPEGSAGLRFFTLELPHEEARAAVLNRLRSANVPVTETPDGILVRDPWGNSILLRIRHNAQQ